MRTVRSINCGSREFGCSGQIHRGHGRLRGPADFIIGTIGVVALESYLPVHDHLRRVDVLDMSGQGVLVLAGVELRRRERIGPAQLVPIFHMLFQRDNADARHGLRSLQARQQRIGGRAGRAGFAGEQFHDHRHSPIVGR